MNRNESFAALEVASITAHLAWAVLEIYAEAVP